jgi:hypothetical protein
MLKIESGINTIIAVSQQGTSKKVGTLYFRTNPSNNVRYCKGWYGRVLHGPAYAPVYSTKVPKKRNTVRYSSVLYMIWNHSQPYSYDFPQVPVPIVRVPYIGTENDNGSMVDMVRFHRSRAANRSHPKALCNSQMASLHLGGGGGEKAGSSPVRGCYGVLLEEEGVLFSCTVLRRR